MAFSNIVIFIGKVFLIECIVEFLRYAAYAIWHNLWPETILLSHDNLYFSLFLNTQETLCVITMLYLGYAIPIIVLCAFFLTFIIKSSYRFFV